MKDKLALLTTILESSYPNYIKKFAPGIQDKKIKEFETERGLIFSKEQVDLYEWKNGMASFYEEEVLKISLFGFGIFLSLEDSYEYYESLCLKDELCPPEYYPIFVSGYGDYHLIKQGDAEFRDPFIYFYSPALLIVEPIRIFDSLPNLISSITDAYSKQILFRNQNNELEERDDYFDFMKDKNPGSAYWK